MFREDDPRDHAGRDARARSAHADHPFTRQLALPEGRRPEQIGDYRLRGSEVRTLATVGSFRVIPRGDLERLSAANSRDVERLREKGLLATTPYMVGSRRTTVVTLTREGLALLEEHRRDCRQSDLQLFYAGVARPRELAHDSRLFAAYVETRERLANDGSRVKRVVLEQQLKSQYQRFLQEPNRGQRHSAGLLRRDREAVSKWAKEQDLPVIRGSVRFPDMRIEYECLDGTRGHEDVEIVTGNYRGAHAWSTKAAGFKCHGYSSARVGGRSSSNRGGRYRDSRLAEEMWR
jgi:DNA-binding MarR family transcriptional regulator